MDDSSFLAAIAESPDDNQRRLVYADWLDENGNTHLAEFVRLLVELAGKRKCRVRKHNRRCRYCEIMARATELATEYGETWGNVVPLVPPDLLVTEIWEIGFRQIDFVATEE